MTEAEFIKKVMKNIGITTTDDDVLAQIRARALTVADIINRGGADINILEATETEILCISLGVQDLLDKKPEYSEGFLGLMHTLQSTAKAVEK
ncbi:MAG: hypothetical protein ACI4Q6_09255 [Huintestinicola sp.]